VLCFSGPNGVFAPVGGGGNTDGGAAIAVADGGLLNGNGTVASPLSATQQFGSDTILRQLNSISSNVNTLEIHNFYTNTTASNETAVWDMTAPLNGAQITQRLTSLNGAGAQAVNSSGSTFSVAWNPQSDFLAITYTQDTTQTTITGTNLDQDGEYEISFTPSIGAGTPTVINVDLNGTTSTYAGIVQFTHATSAGAGLTRITCMDSTLATTVAMARCFVRKIAGKSATWDGVNFNVEGGGNFIEAFAGTSNITANVTSLVLNGTIGNGSVVTVRKTRLTTR